jgi:hypothetical protein
VAESGFRGAADACRGTDRSYFCHAEPRRRGEVGPPLPAHWRSRRCLDPGDVVNNNGSSGNSVGGKTRTGGQSLWCRLTIATGFPNDPHFRPHSAAVPGRVRDGGRMRWRPCIGGSFCAGGSGRRRRRPAVCAAREPRRRRPIAQEHADGAIRRTGPTVDAALCDANHHHGALRRIAACPGVASARSQRGVRSPRRGRHSVGFPEQPKKDSSSGNRVGSRSREAG